MKIDVMQVKADLKAAVDEHREIRKKIENLRAKLVDAGEQPFEPPVSMVPRNKSIWKKAKQGITLKELSREYKLNPSYLSAICKRIDRILQYKKATILSIIKTF